MHDDDSAIRAVLTDYLEGMIWGQPERLERAMHPRCMQAGHYKGGYEYLGRDEFMNL